MPERSGCRAGRFGLSAVLSLLVACVQTPQPAERPVPPVLTVEGAWRINQAMIEPLLDRRRARLDFQADGRLGGDTGCSALAAEYRLSGDRLELGRLVLTRRACAGLQMEQEDRILTALERATTARVRPDGLLELRDAEGRGVLRAARFEP